MSAPVANVSVWVGDHLVCVKIAGRASFACSPDFKALVHGLWDQGRRRFALDLTDCLLVDSTFLGVLVGFSQRLKSAEASGVAGCIELVNASGRILDLLDNLGIAPFFKVIDGTAPVAGRMTELPASATPPDREALSRVSLEAHETLMAVNPENVAKFKDVTKFLAEDLQRMNKSNT